jgi:hypothetical protein
MSGAPEDFDKDPWEGEVDEYGNEELRISADDGMAYTKLEFIAYFGGTSEWAESEVVPQDLVVPEEEAAAAAAATLVAAPTPAEAGAPTEGAAAAVAATTEVAPANELMAQMPVEDVAAAPAAPALESTREEKMAEKAKTMAALANVEDEIEKRNALARAEQAKVEKEHAEELARQDAAARKQMESVRVAESKARQQRLEEKAARAEARATKAKAEADNVKLQAINKRAKVEAKIRAREEKANRAAAKAKKDADQRRAKATEATKRFKEAERHANAAAVPTESDAAGDDALEEEQMGALVVAGDTPTEEIPPDEGAEEGTTLLKETQQDSLDSTGGEGKNRNTAVQPGKIPGEKEKGGLEEIVEEIPPESVHAAALKPIAGDDGAVSTDIDNTVTNSILSYGGGSGSLLTPAQSPGNPSNSTSEHFASFLSPRGATSNQKPKLNAYTVVDLGLSDVDGDGIISARDVSRTIQLARAIEVQEANEDLAQRIQMVQSHYNHERFEESYQHLMQEQQAFSETLMWDRDPEKRHMPISPRLTNFPKMLSPDRDKGRRAGVLPEKRITFGPSKPTSSRSSLSRNTPRKRHVVARGSGAYTATAKDLKGNTSGAKQRKALSAKRMLQHYMRSVEHVPLSVNQVSSAGFSVIKEPRRQKNSSERY